MSIVNAVQSGMVRGFLAVAVTGAVVFDLMGRWWR